MLREPVKSSQVAAIGYDPVNLVLEVEFHPSRLGIISVWSYSPVDAAEYASLIGAPSIGRRFHSIKAAPEITATLVERIEASKEPTEAPK